MTMLRAIPQLVDQLQLAISKQTRIVDQSGARTRTVDLEDDGNDAGLAHTRSPVNWGAVAARDALLVEFALWGATDIDDIRKHPKAAEIASGIGKAVKNAYRAIDRMADRQYLGQCLAAEDGAVCHAELWVAPGAHQVQCTQCETVHNVSELREKRMDEAEDLIVTPREASSYVGEVGRIQVGQQRIRNYLDRGRIPKRPSPDGLLRFRLGDLLAVLREEAARHDVRAS